MICFSHIATVITLNLTRKAEGKVDLILRGIVFYLFIKINLICAAEAKVSRPGHIIRQEGGGEGGGGGREKKKRREDEAVAHVEQIFENNNTGCDSCNSMT